MRKLYKKFKRRLTNAYDGSLKCELTSKNPASNWIDRCFSVVGGMLLGFLFCSFIGDWKKYILSYFYKEKTV